MSFWRVPIDEDSGKALGEPEPVVTPAKVNRHLGFSRDGKRMIYVQTDDQSNIQAVEFDAASEKLLHEPMWITRGDRLVVRPELSPDGQRFVMRLPRRTQDDIVVVNRDGTNWRDLTNDKYFDRYPRWSPDGKQVAFASDRSGNYEIWIADAETAKLRQLTFDSPPSTSFPIWSPDGKQMLFRRADVTLIIDPKKNWSEQTPQALPAPAGQAHFVVWDWSPDGKNLLGTLYSDHASIACFSFETQRFERVADFDAQPMWLPDSRRFVFAYEGKAFIGNILTRKVHELLNLPTEQVRSVGVSRDGKLFYYSVFSSESDIWLLDLE